MNTNTVPRSPFLKHVSGPVGPGCDASRNIVVCEKTGNASFFHPADSKNFSLPLIRIIFRFFIVMQPN